MGQNFRLVDIKFRYIITPKWAFPSGTVTYLRCEDDWEKSAQKGGFEMSRQSQFNNFINKMQLKMWSTKFWSFGLWGHK